MRVCLVSSGLEERNERLQPWRYLFDTADKLQQIGRDVCLLSDGYPRLPMKDNIGDLSVTRVSNLESRPGHKNRQITQTIANLHPEVVLWHLGLTSFLHLPPLAEISVPTIGVFTSPVYKPRELFRLGALCLLRGQHLSIIHLLGLLVPKHLIQRALKPGRISHLVVECETTRRRLIERGAAKERITVIRPRIDQLWFDGQPDAAKRGWIREELGFRKDNFVVGYLGPPTPLRGLPTLLKAVAIARANDSRINLLILSRQQDDELRAAHREVKRLMAQLGAERWAHMVAGFLCQEQLIQRVAACDAIALPFEIVPSDVPLSVLEAMALGMALIATQVACLPELVPPAVGLCIPPMDAQALSEAIHTLASDEGSRHELARASRIKALSWKAQSEDLSQWARLLEQ
jgi:glycosyltransferase involved in cell wall biosynthesis